MSGVGFSEFLILCMIGLIVLGPKRLPKVANQIGTWVGQARRMTRVMKRQLEEELDFDKDLNIKPGVDHSGYTPPRNEDTYSPLHGDEPTSVSDVKANETIGLATAADEADEMDSVEADGEKRRDA